MSAGYTHFWDVGVLPTKVLENASPSSSLGVKNRILRVIGNTEFAFAHIVKEYKTETEPIWCRFAVKFAAIVELVQHAAGLI